MLNQRQVFSSTWLRQYPECTKVALTSYNYIYLGSATCSETRGKSVLETIAEFGVYFNGGKAHVLLIPAQCLYCCNNKRDRRSFLGTSDDVYALDGLFSGLKNMQYKLAKAFVRTTKQFYLWLMRLA